VVVYGSDEHDTMGEHAYHLTHPSKFSRHYNEGYSIIIFGGDVPSIKDQAWLLQAKSSSSKDTRWHLHDIGIESGVLTVEEFRELFAWALDADNVLLTPTLLNC
jgi:hypothetical protein